MSTSFFFDLEDLPIIQNHIWYRDKDRYLVKCDKIHPDWCACGICSLKAAGYKECPPVEITIGYDSIEKTDENVACSIKE